MRATQRMRASCKGPNPLSTLLYDGLCFEKLVLGYSSSQTKWHRPGGPLQGALLRQDWCLGILPLGQERWLRLGLRRALLRQAGAWVFSLPDQKACVLAVNSYINPLRQAKRQMTRKPSVCQQRRSHFPGQAAWLGPTSQAKWLGTSEGRILP